MREIIALLLFASTMTVSALDLVRSGRPAAELILPAGALHVERFAVTDIQHWIKEMSGATVPIVGAPTGRANTKIFVGKQFATGFTGDLKKLEGTDGYAIRAKGQNVYIFGDRPRGTAYGVWRFLEKNSDIIWARPNTEFGTVFGTHKNLRLETTSIIDIPAFPVRYQGGGHPPQMIGAEWQARNGSNATGRGQYRKPAGWDMIHMLGGDLFYHLRHNLKAHPEWFGYNPETKSRDVHAGAGSLCLTHPGLPEIWVKRCTELVKKREAERGRKVDYMIVGPGDNWFCCCCPKCLKPLELPNGKLLKPKHAKSEKDPLFRSTQYYMFLNQAMKTWKKELPHVKLVSLAYIYLAEPPAVDIDPDLWIFFAPYPTNSMRWPLLHPRQNGEWRRRFETWLTRTKNLGFYEYLFSKPSPQGDYIATNLRALKHPQTSFIYTEYTNDRPSKSSIGGGDKGWDVGGMNSWVINRLFWNPNQDVDELYKYYFTRTYREAAPHMIKYYETIRDSWRDPKNKANDSAHASLSGVYRGMVIDMGLEKKTNQYLADALKAAKHPKSKIMVARMQAAIAEYSKGMARMIVPEIEEMAHDGHTFASVQWEKPAILDDFRTLDRSTDKGAAASQKTELKAAWAKDKLYLRLTAYDTEIRKAKAKKKDSTREFWPKGDHAELWFSLPGGKTCVFAFDCHGNKYDARNYDRDWNSQWKVRTQKTNDRWEAIAVIPLAALGLNPEEKTKAEWFCIREIHHGQKVSELVSYQGQRLFRRMYPINFQ